jgi:hypothetical protein
LIKKKRIAICRLEKVENQSLLYYHTAIQVVLLLLAAERSIAKSTTFCPMLKWHPHRTKHLLRRHTASLFSPCAHIAALKCKTKQPALFGGIFWGEAGDRGQGGHLGGDVEFGEQPGASPVADHRWCHHQGREEHVKHRTHARAHLTMAAYHHSATHIYAIHTARLLCNHSSVLPFHPPPLPPPSQPPPQIPSIN